MAKYWKKVLWKKELVILIFQFLKDGDMTSIEIATKFKKMNIRIHYSAINSILDNTEGIYVKRKINSTRSDKEINVYTIGIFSTP